MMNVSLYAVTVAVLVVMMHVEHRQLHPVEPRRGTRHAMPRSLDGAARVGLAVLALALVAPVAWRLLP
jgi:hypothetical protein